MPLPTPCWVLCLIQTNYHIWKSWCHSEISIQWVRNVAGRELLNCGWNLKWPFFLLGTKPFTWGATPTPGLLRNLATLTFNVFHISLKQTLTHINLSLPACLSLSPSPSPGWEILFPAQQEIPTNEVPKATAAQDKPDNTKEKLRHWNYGEAGKRTRRELIGQLAWRTGQWAAKDPTASKLEVSIGNQVCAPFPPHSNYSIHTAED